MPFTDLGSPVAHGNIMGLSLPYKPYWNFSPAYCVMSNEGVKRPWVAGARLY
jgi:hypothetical protein